MLQRVAGVVMVFLAAMTILQLIALRRMRVEIATLRAEVEAVSIEPRREEIVRAGEWLHAWLQSPDGGAKPGGLCPGGAPDVNAMASLLFDTYLHARAAGASESAAREAVLRRARAAR